MLSGAYVDVWSQRGEADATAKVIPIDSTNSP